MTDVQHSDVKKQSIGNCWAYATLGWVESLRLEAYRDEMDLSESYLSYWRWFDQITGGDVDGDLVPSGSWGIGAELILRFGMMREDDFPSREREALDAIQLELRAGLPGDGRAVRAALNKAFGLSGEQIALLDDVFGEDGRAEPRWRAPIVGADDLDLGDGVTLADRFGRRNPVGDLGHREGEHAWSETSYPSKTAPPFATDYDRRVWLARLQRALHDGEPVLISWFVDFNAQQGGAFLEPPDEIGRQGSHSVLLEDYEVTDVPGYGTLEVGKPVTDPEALAAALDDDARVVLLRAKNSWGTLSGPDDEFRGYLDLHMRYLNGPVRRCTERDGNGCVRAEPIQALKSAVLPPGY